MHLGTIGRHLERTWTLLFIDYGACLQVVQIVLLSGDNCCCGQRDWRTGLWFGGRDRWHQAQGGATCTASKLQWH